jgi:1-acyl-sn-glycerol-3-phosphate acyltransferase
VIDNCLQGPTQLHKFLLKMKKVEQAKNGETWKAFLVMGLIFPLHIILGVFSIPTWIYFICIGSRNAWLLALLYLPFFLYPAQLKYPGWKGVEAFWRFMDYENSGKSYFGDFAVHGIENVKKDQQYSIACHPHGVLIFQRTFWRCYPLDKHFKDWRMLGASALFSIPIVREMSLWFGAIDASKKTCEKVLKAGISLVLFPGGLDEANSTEGNGDDVRLKTRTGFIRLAVKYNTPVLPVFTFGELDCVTAVNLFPVKIARWIKKKFRMSSTIFIGRFGTFMPFRVPFNMCIGKPIVVKHCLDEGVETDAEVCIYICLYITTYIYTYTYI